MARKANEQYVNVNWAYEKIKMIFVNTSQHNLFHSMRLIFFLCVKFQIDIYKLSTALQCSVRLHFVHIVILYGVRLRSGRVTIT
jgi:hypothetical protein